MKFVEGGSLMKWSGAADADPARGGTNRQGGTHRSLRA